MDDQLNNQVSPTNMPFARRTIWMSNPKLKSLLLILMAVFFLSGIALASLSYLQTERRQKLYELTEASLPKHTVKEAGSVNGTCLSLPENIANNSVFRKWLEDGKFDQKDLCGKNPQNFKFGPGSSFSSEQDCLASIKEFEGQGQSIVSPNRQRSICMGNFGEPDSYVYLIDGSFGQSGREVKTCGTPCDFQNGLWLDNDKFVLLEKDDIEGNGESVEYLATLYDFQKMTGQMWYFSQETSP